VIDGKSLNNQQKTKEEEKASEKKHQSFSFQHKNSQFFEDTEVFGLR
jgi:hypothetical protein